MKYQGLNCIMLIDDNRLTNLVHTKAIQRSQIETTVKDFENVQDALSFLTDKENSDETTDEPCPGIIFLDINMPGLNGWDFIERYKKLDYRLRAKVIVVMLTTSLDPKEEQRARLDDQIIAFLNKPLRPAMVEELAEKYF